MQETDKHMLAAPYVVSAMMAGSLRAVTAQEKPLTQLGEIREST